MQKRRSTLLRVSAVCIAALVLGPALARWRLAPWNHAAARPLAAWRPVNRPEFLAWSADGKTVLSNRERCVPELWREGGAPLPGAATVDPMVSCASGGALSLDGRWFARDADNGLAPGVKAPPGAGDLVVRQLPHAARRIELVDCRTGRVGRRLFWPASSARPEFDPRGYRSFSPNGRYLVASAAVGPMALDTTQPGLACAWDTETGRLEWSRSLESPVSDLEVAIYVTTRRGRLWHPRGPAPDFFDNPTTVSTLHDVATGQTVMPLPRPPRGQIPDTGLAAAALAPQGDTLVVCFGNDFSGQHVPQELYACNLQTRRFLWRKPGDSLNVERLSLSPDGRLLAVGGTRGKITQFDAQLRSGRPLNQLQILDARSGQLLRTLDDSTPYLRAAASLRVKRDELMERIRPDGTVFIRPLREASIPVALAWSHDSSRLAVAYMDGMVKVWRASGG